MNIKRETIVSVMIDEEKELKVGDFALFIANGVAMMGMFDGITKRGCLTFRNNVNGTPIIFNVLPSSIKEMEIYNGR